MLNEDGTNNLNFELELLDESFDNSDNPYGNWIYHRYSNMKNIDDIAKNKEGIVFFESWIPLVKCEQSIESRVGWSSGKNRNYCPQYGKDDFLYGGFDTFRFSWNRLAFHFCDNSTESRLEKIK